MEISAEDMYGNPITPLAETGYGVSVSIAYVNSGTRGHAVLTVFHASDGFRQSLFSVAIDGPDRPTLQNIFPDRLAELWVLNPHERK